MWSFLAKQYFCESEHNVSQLNAKFIWGMQYFCKNDCSFLVERNTFAKITNVLQANAEFLEGTQYFFERKQVFYERMENVLGKHNTFARES